MSEFFEQAAIAWDQDPGRVRMAKTIADAMIRTLQPDGTEVVLDYGTGTGLIALQLRPHVQRIVAVDSAKNMLAFLHQKLATEGITSVEPREWSVGKETRDLPRTRPVRWKHIWFQKG
jgi:ubiquinone/menaquinone biosynthesis C-methylase UbiE